jgi:phosphoribosyl-AMP cyclohydrolase
MAQEVTFDGQGLVAVVVQDSQTRDVLMLAYMNQEALDLTLSTGEATYFSRSRQEIWRKGATSGNTQRVVSISHDCDRDALLMQVEQTGVACHTGTRSCFTDRSLPQSAGD